MKSRTGSLALVIALAIAGQALAQDPPRAGRGAAGRGRGAAARAKEGPWFGVPLPPPLGVEPAVIVGDRQPRPFVMPSGEAAAPELAGATIRKDLEAIVGISKESRATHEVG